MNENDIRAQIRARDNEIAAANRAFFNQANLLCINLLGSPGAGKTSVILGLKPLLGERLAKVLESDLESDIDTKKLLAAGIGALQVNTHGACHLDPGRVQAVLDELRGISGFFVIENIGNLVCPALVDIGQHLKLLVVTPADGSDKPYKYPPIFEAADAVVLHKSDLAEHVEFDRDEFMQGLREINPTAPLFMTTIRDAQSFKPLADWLTERYGQSR